MGGALALACTCQRSPAQILELRSLLQFEGPESISNGIDRCLRDTYTAVSDGRLYTTVRRIIHSLAPAYEMDASAIDLCILIDPTVNALSTKRMYIFTGALDFCNTEDELAGIIAHELVHIKEQHLVGQIIEAEVRDKSILAGEIALTIAIAKLSTHISPSRPFTPNSQGQITQLGFVLSNRTLQTLGLLVKFGFLREQEYEADATATKALKASGYKDSCLQDVLARLDVYAQSQQQKQIRLASAEDKYEGAIDGHYLNSSNVSLSERLQKLHSILGH